MSYMALYRKWRPMTFDDVVEQSSVVTILRNTVVSQRIAHAYLFCGTRGTGKTSLAKIFSRAINCLNPDNGSPCNSCEICTGILNGQILDVSEIDAASNNGVDNIRSIIEESAYSAARAKYRVYIIDEVHMLSSGAFNALLKTLEEPPANVVFILATTEPHKLPVTILSRCQRYDFKRISRDGIVERLEEICKSQNIEYEINALNFIAQKSDGAMRDAISLLDQTIASCDGVINIATARNASGSLNREFTEAFAEKLLLSDGTSILQFTDTLFTNGSDPSNFISELMGLFRNMLVSLTVRNPQDLLYENPEEMERLKKLASLTNVSEIAILLQELSKLDTSMKWAVQRKIIFEAGMLRLCDRNWSSSDMDLSVRIKYLEERVSDLIQSGLKVANIQSNTKIQTNPFASKTTADKTVESMPEASVSEAPTESAPWEDSTPVHEKTDNKKAKLADNLDKKDFFEAITKRKKPAIAALLQVSSKIFITDHKKICIVFDNTNVKDKLQNENCFSLLKEAASEAFGFEPSEIVFLSSVEWRDFDDNTEEEPTKEEEIEPGNDEDFTIALGNLGKLAESEGFNINIT